MTSIGMNLTGVTYWSTSEPFLDRFKTSRAWTETKTDGTSDSKVSLDALGNPLAIPTGAKAISTAFEVDPLSAGTSNEYVLTYSGTATFSLSGTKIVSSTPGRIVFDVTNANATSVGMSVTAMSASDPLHDIHVVRADQVALYNTGEIFNPAFVDKMSQWDVTRFMGWENTNTLAPVTWATRSTTADASWATNNSPDGVPLEVMVKLANEAHTDMWYNVPTEADDTYVKNALAYIRDNLSPDLKVHVEYSNEVWNASYDAFDYAQNQANALWAVDANHNGTVDAGENVTNGRMVYYGYRSAQIASIAHEVFGSESDDRLVDVISGQSTSASLTKYTMQGVDKAGLGSASSLFDAYAIAPYFGNELSNSTRNAADEAKIVGWAHAGAAGIDAAFHELEYGGDLSKDDSLAAVVKDFAAQAAVAKQYGLELVTYEAGASLTTSNFTAAEQPDVSAFFGKLMNDPRMGTLYTELVNDFAAAGGGELTAMNEAGRNATSGYWGVLDTIYDTSSPRYDALTRAEAADAGLSPVSHAASSSAAVAAIVAGSLITGTSGSDVLAGGAGNDTIDGGLGADRMTGGAGNDLYLVDDAGDKVVEAADGGIDTVHTTLATYSLGANVENLGFTGMGNFYGAGNALANVVTGGDGNDSLYGNDGSDTLAGGGGNDMLNGGSGADRMAGGTGDDSYYVDNAGDQVIENAGEGNDIVYATISYSLPVNVETLRMGDGAIDGTGNDLANLIQGNSAANHIFGNGGDDTISGGDGADTISGGAGNDTVVGDAGNDVLSGNAGDDSINGGDGNDVISGGGGHDLLRGGAGADRFVFAPGELTADRATTAVIQDFTHADGDLIDLTAIDANGATSTDDAFRFLGTAAFTKHAGELREQANGGYWDVMGDTNGDGIADFVIEVSSKAGMLAASDFLM